MTRLTVPLFAKTPLKKFNNYKPLHPFKIPLTPVLGNKVPNTDLLGKGSLCIDEMSSLMSCWKRHEFATDKCEEEIEKFQKCVIKADADHESLKQKLKSGKVKVKGRYNPDTVNKQLNKFPQPPCEIKPK